MKFDSFFFKRKPEIIYPIPMVFTERKKKQIHLIIFDLYGF